MTTFKTKRDGLLNFSDYKGIASRIAYIVFIFLLVIFALTAIIPILWLFITSFKSVGEINSSTYHLFPETFNIGKLVDVWKKVNFGRYFLNTLLVVVGAIVVAVVFNGLIAYSVGVLKPVGHKAVNGLILLGYMVPAALCIFPLVMQLKSLKLINNAMAFLPLCFTFGANAYYYLLFKDFFAKLPKSIIEAARIDGCSDLGIFFRIVIPLSRPIIGVVAIFAMSAAYSDFLLPYTLLQDQSLQTVMVAIYRLSTTSSITLDASELLMLLVISIIPQIIIVLIFQKQIMNNAANSGNKE